MAESNQQQKLTAKTAPSTTLSGDKRHRRAYSSVTSIEHSLLELSPASPFERFHQGPSGIERGLNTPWGSIEAQIALVH
jgi:hypothetical protein